MISPYVRRLRLAAELRDLRKQSGLTHEQLAKKIGESRAQISRLENGHVVDQSDIMKILDVLGVEDDRWIQMMTIAREAGERGWWESNRAMGERQALYANIEAGAATVREFQMIFVPGLLQTAEYAVARVDAELAVGKAGFTADDVVSARVGRQRMLRRPSGPTYEVVLDELAVRRPSVPAEVMKAQLYHVTATVNSSPKFSVRVLPVEADIEEFSVPRSTFAMYTFTDPGDPTVVAVDTVTDDLMLTDSESVKRYEDLFNRLQAAAMPEKKSLEFLISLADEV